MHANRLAREKSPYLLQHAHNPVDWYPWGEEAFEKAHREDKPIFLSIGYSTCHWCHVMERESFENEAIAELINRWFVPIKVDREERPDIDQIYMAYVQASTGGGGWPMSVWLTPDRKPFVGGTYFPPDNRYGRAGFPIVLERIAEAWKTDRAKIVESSEAVMEQLKARANADGERSSRPIEVSILDSAYQNFRRAFDPKRGGFGGAPKFPRPSIHNFLLRYANRTGNEEAREMVVETLLAMARGGMNDQLGGGFHRYSVDEYWFVPHFEKMLYDQAQLAISYLEAFQLTGEEKLAAIARRILDYVAREMTSAEGGFYSAEDADSAPDAANPKEKSEGAFYIWSMAEVRELLGEERARKFAYHYGMEDGGNVGNDPHHEFTGRNILFEAHTAEGPLGEATLFEHRAKRPRPHLDDKILTSWNGLMISAFSKGAAIFGHEPYAEAARRAAEFILTTLRRPDGLLLRRFRDGEAAIEGMLDDYAFFAQGLLDLYEATFDFRFLETALAITEKQRELFEDAVGGGFYASAQPDATALMRVKDDYDGAEPSGNSISLSNLLRLHRITGRQDLEDCARRLIGALRDRAAESPFGLPQFLAACEFDLAPPREIVIAGNMASPMLRRIWKNFDPNRVLLYAAPEIASWQPATAAMTAGSAADSDASRHHTSETAVFLCENFTCKTPARNEADLDRLLK
jgi:uncharacterized protein YyaL (SSP411 family)